MWYTFLISVVTLLTGIVIHFNTSNSSNPMRSTASEILYLLKALLCCSLVKGDLTIRGHMPY